jgi:cytochrome c-type biogenesis protein CcmH
VKHLFISFFLLFSSLGVCAKEAPLLAQDPIVEQRLISISEELRCLVCQNESLAGSRADLAQDLRQEVREMIKQGKSDEQIKEFLVSRYGDFVLYRPPVKPVTWLLWLGPFAFLFVGILVLWNYMRHRQSQIKDVPLTDEESKRVEALLQESDRD